MSTTDESTTNKNISLFQMSTTDESTTNEIIFLSQVSTTDENTTNDHDKIETQIEKIKIEEKDSIIDLKYQ